MSKTYILRDFFDSISTGTLREQNVITFMFGIPNYRELTSEEQNLSLDEVREHLECNAHTLEETFSEFGLTRENRTNRT